MVDITLILVLFSVLSGGYITYILKGRLFSLGVFFNSYSALYFVMGIAIYKYDILNGNEPDTLVTLAQLSLVAVLSFNIPYLLALYSSKNVRPLKPSYTESYTPSYQMVLTVFLTGVIAIAIVISKVGFIAYFFIDRLDRFPIFKQYQHLIFIGKAVNIALILCLYRYSTFQQRRDKILAIIIFCYCAFFAVLTISRSELAFLFISIFFFVEKHRVMKTKTLVLLGLLMALMMLVYKGILYILILGEIDVSAYNPGEFINWIRNSSRLLDNNYDATDLPNNSYWLALKSMFMIDPGGDALSEWYIQRFHPDRLVLGLTYGFSGLLEGYLYLGHLGVMLHFMSIGILFAVMDTKYGPIATTLSICAMYIMFRLFRSEIYNFARTFTWYFVYQVVLICAVDYFLIRISLKAANPQRLSNN